MDTWKTALFIVALVSASGCSMFKSHEKTGQKQNTKTVQKNTPKDWSSRIGDSKYTVNSSSTGESLYGGQSDRIGRAQIEQLSMAGPSSAPKVAVFLSDPSSGVRQKAVEILGKFGEKGSAALPRILKVLTCNNPQLRLSGAQALALMKIQDSKEYLERALDDSSLAVRAWAHAGLVSLGEDCTDHMEDTAKILSAAPGTSPMEAMRALSMMKCASDDAVESLIEALDSPHESIRSAAARAIGNMGASAKAAVPKLGSLLKEKSFRVRLSALLALGHMGTYGIKALDGLIACLSDPSPKFRQLAAFAIGKIGPEASSALDALKKATHDSEATVVAAATKALALVSSGSNH